MARLVCFMLGHRNVARFSYRSRRWADDCLRCGRNNLRSD